MSKSAKMFSAVAVVLVAVLIVGNVLLAAPKKPRPKRKPQPSGIELPKDLNPSPSTQSLIRRQWIARNTAQSRLTHAIH